MNENLTQNIIETALPIWREHKAELEQRFDDFASFCDEIRLEISN
jgi:hypothetical protein